MKFHEISIFLHLFVYKVALAAAFGYSTCSVVREDNAAFMVWRILNIYTGYLSDKFGPNKSKLSA